MEKYVFEELTKDEYTVKDGAFKYKGNKTSIIIPDDVEIIKSTSFTKIKAVRLGKNVSKVNTNNVEWFEVDDANENFSSVDGVLFDKKQEKLVYYPLKKSQTDYTVPSSVTVIGFCAFEHTKLKTITLHDNIKSIGYGAFKDIPKLTSLTWPVGTPVISKSVLRNSGISSISIPDTVVEIGDDAFGGCESLTEIEIPNSVVSFGESDFPMGVFSGCKNLKSVIMSDNIEKLPRSNFAKCENLQYVKLPKNLKEIDPYVFDGCKSLTSLELPDGLLKINDHAFTFSSITSIAVPDSVQETGTIFKDVADVKRNRYTEADLEKKAEVDKKREEYNKIVREIDEVKEKLAELKEDGIFVYEKNAKRLVKNRDDNENKLNDLLSSGRYSEYKQLLLKVNEIPPVPKDTYNYCGKDIKLYNRNGVDGTAAIEVSGRIYLFNVINSTIGDSKINYSTDASELDNAIMTGIAGGPFLGYLATSVARVYNNIDLSFSLYRIEPVQLIVKVSFGDNYKVQSAQFKTITDKISSFLGSLSDLTENVSIDEQGTYVYIRDKLSDIRQSFIDKEKRLEQKRQKEKEEEIQRIEKYWAEHPEEKQQLEAERQELEGQIESLKSNMDAQISTLNKEIEDSSCTDEIAQVDAKITQLTNQKSSLGFFKGKEKKAIQGQIDQALAKKNTLQDRISKDIQEKKTKISSVKSTAQSMIDKLQNRIDQINNEFTKAR